MAPPRQRTNGSKLRHLPLAYHNARGDSVEIRLAHRHGRQPATWHAVIYGPGNAYDTVAKVNRELVEMGQSARALALMIPIDESLAAPVRLCLSEALHKAEIADALEQITDEVFREKIRQGTATVTEAREYIRRSCAARCEAEKAEQAVERWIDEQSVRP